MIDDLDTVLKLLKKHKLHSSKIDEGVALSKKIEKKFIDAWRSLGKELDDAPEHEHEHLATAIKSGVSSACAIIVAGTLMAEMQEDGELDDEDETQKALVHIIPAYLAAFHSTLLRKINIGLKGHRKGK